MKSLQLEPGSGGCFEVFVDGDPIYSKLATGTFPDFEQVLAQTLARLG